MTEKVPSRDEINAQEKWDLSSLFKDDTEWEKLFTDVEQLIPGYTNFQGRLHESLEIFRKAIEFELSLSRQLEKIYTFAHLRNDEDTANQETLGRYQRALNLYTRISEASSFLTPEIQSVPEAKITVYMQDSSMKEYRFFLEKILRYQPYTRSQEIEEILAMSGEVTSAPSQIFNQLDNADLKFGLVTDENGKEVELSHASMSSFLIKQDRSIREKAFFKYYESYQDHKNTISTALAYSIKKDCFYARVRKFTDSRKAPLFSDNVSESVYDNLIDSVKKNFPPLFDYFAFRKKTMGLDELHFYDTYVPLVPEITFHMTYEEAVETCCAALAPLGEEYVGILKKGLLSGWVDRYENRGKRSGAYSSGCYDSPPYILMNYRPDTINSLYTLIHEAGHSMHSYYAKKNQPYVSHDYTIFVAEVASTFNETLLSSYLLNKYKDDKAMKAYILNREIDNIRGTLYRQTMFAEFEKITHRISEENMPLTLEVMQTEYRTLLEAYFGDTMIIDKALTLEFLRIPHFYSAFYVYKYATGISAAIALADMVLNGDETARDRYLNFLSLGGSMFPIDELKEAGVDMTTPKPVESALAHFSFLVNQLKEEL